MSYYGKDLTCEPKVITKEEADKLKAIGMYWELEHLFVVEGEEA